MPIVSVLVDLTGRQDCGYVTFHLQAAGWWTRPHEAVHALQQISTIQLVARETLVVNHLPHWDGELRLGEVHVAVRRDHGPQTA